jgi:hypothetical protein
MHAITRQKITAEMRAPGVRLACCSTAQIITARIGRRSAVIDGRMTCACPIWSRGLPAKLVAGAALKCGPIGNRLKRMPDTEPTPRRYIKFLKFAWGDSMG